MAERVVFSRSLYLPEAVRAAADAYRHLARLEVRLSDEDIEVLVDEPDPEVAPILVDELSNHVLHETIVRRRG